MFQNGCILVENNFTSNLQMVSSAFFFGPKGFGAIPNKKHELQQVSSMSFHGSEPTGTAGSGGVSYPSPCADLSTIASQA